MQPPRAGTLTKITDRLAFIEQAEYCELHLGVEFTKLSSIEAIHLRNLLTQWKNDKTKRDNKAKYRKSTTTYNSN